ncbi:Protein of unknown function [Cotesia congregata]|uniref:Uncharacterized protein n=1 Tax=Cotesia congregata TaxID=51543 RepID=A0A8J2H705_COTCN|nr:Protein of unknown function [Cotesia congregata]
MTHMRSDSSLRKAIPRQGRRNNFKNKRLLTLKNYQRLLRISRRRLTGVWAPLEQQSVLLEASLSLGLDCRIYLGEILQERRSTLWEIARRHSGL